MPRVTRPGAGTQHPGLRTAGAQSSGSPSRTRGRPRSPQRSGPPGSVTGVREEGDKTERWAVTQRPWRSAPHPGPTPWGRGATPSRGRSGWGGGVHRAVTPPQDPREQPRPSPRSALAQDRRPPPCGSTPGLGALTSASPAAGSAQARAPTLTLAHCACQADPARLEPDPAGWTVTQVRLRPACGRGQAAARARGPSDPSPARSVVGTGSVLQRVVRESERGLRAGPGPQPSLLPGLASSPP